MHIHAYRVGAILTILGPFTYFVSGTSSLSAFIPSIFGVLFIIIARLANNEKIRPHVMHFGLFVALVGILGLAPMLLENGDDFIRGEASRPWAVFSQLITTIALVYFLSAGIQSFRSARTKE
ncbi:MAG: hypothetical protein CL872_07090 [Dehalococcoidaceae bacterium]|nr:hypothetical protein [Dehalococcoidaceae bacterium]|tara:strand:- start:27031 stop:27396 length:366 start_codon:yes stop_codon:yes gene_type:complete